MKLDNFRKESLRFNGKAMTFLDCIVYNNATKNINLIQIVFLIDAD